MVMQDKQIDRPGVSAGDSVYYRHPETGNAHHGVVAAIGEHGFLADADGGEEHRVTWDKFLGHRKRAERSAKVVDRGEDGFLMEDEAGRRLFVRGSADDVLGPNDGDTMAKSQSVESPDHALLLKAQIVREMAAAGFEPMIDYVRDTFGDNFVYKQPAHDPSLDALDGIVSALSSHVQGLSAAIALLAERLEQQEQINRLILSSMNRDATIV